MARILVVCGGDNMERRVSLASGDAVARGLKAAGHDVVKLDTAAPTKLAKPDETFLEGVVGPTPPDELSRAKLMSSGWGMLVGTIAMAEPDAVFPILHGSWGEDGRFQALLDMMGIPFLGSGVLASQLCMNKVMTKEIAEKNELPLAKGFIVDLGAYVEDVIKRAFEELGSPVVAKPMSSGSALDVFICDDGDKLRTAIRAILKSREHPLLEEYIPGKELTVAVLDGKALPVVEIAPKTSFYDYTRKYTKGETEYLCPAPIPDKAAQELMDYSERIFGAAGCRHVARADWRYDPESGSLAFLEVNTIPGMTDLSLVPMAARETGLDFPALMNRFVELALKKK